MIATFLLLTSFASLAAGGGSSYLPSVDNTWEEIENDYYYRLMIGYPTISLDNGGHANVGSVCFDGVKLRTLKKLSKCVEYSRPRRGQRECVQRAYYTGVAEINGTRTRCAEWNHLGRGERECARYEDVSYSIPLENEVPVYQKIVGRGEVELKLLFHKTHNIPSCQ